MAGIASQRDPAALPFLLLERITSTALFGGADPAIGVHFRGRKIGLIRHVVMIVEVAASVVQTVVNLTLKHCHSAPTFTAQSVSLATRPCPDTVSQAAFQSN
jgi:hypothetical protein